MRRDCQQILGCAFLCPSHPAGRDEIRGQKKNRMFLTFTNSQRRAPLIPQNVQTDATVAVDVRVINAGGEVDLRGLEGVVGREVNREEEDAAGVWRIAGSHDGCLPVELFLSVLWYGVAQHDISAARAAG